MILKSLIEFFLILVEISVSVCPTTPGAGVSNTEPVSPKASKLHQGILQQTMPPYTKLYSFRFSCRMVSFTAAKTNLMFSVSVAQVK